MAPGCRKPAGMAGMSHEHKNRFNVDEREDNMKKMTGKFAAICTAVAVAAAGLTGCGTGKDTSDAVNNVAASPSEELSAEASAEPAAEPTSKPEKENKREAEEASKAADDSKTSAEAEAKTESSTAAKTNSKTEAKTESSTPAKTDNNTPAKTESNTPAKAESNTPAKTESSTPAETESKTESKTETEAKPEAPAESKTEPVQAESKPQAPAEEQKPAHTCSFVETGRSSSTDCFQGLTTTTVSYACSCGQTKAETSTVAAGCSWEWVGDTSYDNSGCVATTISTYMCTTHGTNGNQPPRIETVDGHDRQENRTEPTCECEGFVLVYCTKCGTHFSHESLGGGQGHSFAETSRRPMSEEEAAWNGSEGSIVTYTCTKCGFSYDDIG